MRKQQDWYKYNCVVPQLRSGHPALDSVKGSGIRQYTARLNVGHVD